MSITVYSRVSCGPCKELKKYLSYKQVEYQEVDADTIDLQALTGSRIVPTVIVDTDEGQRIITGYNPSALASLLS